MSELHGAIVVDKPGGMTSHDVVAGARRALGTRAVGHAGTLDPMATGVLVLLAGEALKLSGYVTQDAKRYLAHVAFGRRTDSDDAAGAVLEEVALTPGWLEPSRLAEAVRLEAERTVQTPPAVSAIRIGGERAHRLSRKGAAPEMPARSVRVLELETSGFDDRGADFALWVSKGYYVRAFARDLGARLGVPAHLSALRRTASGRFSLAEANPWPLPAEPRVLSVAEAAGRALPILRLTAEGARRARLGQGVRAEHLSAPVEPASAETYALSAPGGELVALARPREPGELGIVRGFTPH